MKRAVYACLLMLALGAAHVWYWYLPRERAAAPRLGAAGGGGQPAAVPAGSPAPGASSGDRRDEPPAPAAGTGRAVAVGEGGGVAEPLQLLAGGAYDVCLWLPYPHQNLGVLAAAIGDPQDLIEAAVRLTADLNGNAGDAGNAGNAGNAGDMGKEAAARRAREPEELPTFGPFQVPPASELVACSDLAGGRLRVVARIYPALAVVAKLAGRLAGNPWLAGGAAGNTRVTWSGRLWSATAGAELPPAAAAAEVVPAPAAPPAPGQEALGLPTGPAGAIAGGGETAGGEKAGAGKGVELPESLAVVHWMGARPEIPAGYYTLTRQGSDLALSLVGAAGGAGAAGRAGAAGSVGRTGAAGSAAGAGGAADAGAMLLAGAGPLPALLLAVGPDWRSRMAGVGGPGRAAAASAGGRVADAGAGRSAPPAPLAPAALALFETSSLRITSLGDLPGVAVFNAAGAAGAARWRLPTEGLFRLLGGRLPTGESAGWNILALDPESLRQAAALAPRLAVLVPPAGTAAAPGPDAAPGAGAAAAVPGAAAPAGPPLSLGIWLEPRTALRIVSRVRRFVEGFPLASHHQVELWRDWETVLEPLANCGGATLTATAAPPTMRLLMRDCTAAGPR
jgi:hypothetical protein